MATGPLPSPSIVLDRRSLRNALQVACRPQERDCAMSSLIGLCLLSYLEGVIILKLLRGCIAAFLSVLHPARIRRVAGLRRRVSQASANRRILSTIRRSGLFDED